MTRLLVVVAGSLPLLAAAGESDRRVQFEYVLGTRADGCADEESVRRRVTAILQYDPFQPDAKDTVRARVFREGDGFAAEIEFRDEADRPRGARRLPSEGPTCDALISAVVLAVAIAIDPDAALLDPSDARRLGRAEPAPEPEPPEPEPPQPEPPEPEPPQPEPPEPEPRPKVPSSPADPPPALDPFAALSIHAALGSAPGPATGFGLLGGVRRRNLSAGLGVRLDLPAFRESREGRISGWLVLGTLLSCAHHGLLETCGVAAGGLLRSAGHDFDRRRKATTPLAMVGARLGLALGVSESLTLVVHGDALLTLLDTALLIDSEQVWKTPRVSGAMGAGVRWRIP